MKLAIYQYCDESQRHPHELSIRFAWCDRPPARNDVVAMGADASWQIAEVSSFKYDVQSNVLVDEIFAVSVYRGECPTRSEWELNWLKSMNPKQSLQVQVTDVGGAVLGFELDLEGQRPSVGRQLVHYGIREDTFVTRREAWQVSKVVGYLPTDSVSSFFQIYLVFHLSDESSVLVDQR